MRSEPEHVAVCQCQWAVSTRGQEVTRNSVESVAEAHAAHCGPVQLRRIDEPPADEPLAEADGETIATFEGQA